MEASKSKYPPSKEGGDGESLARAVLPRDAQPREVAGPIRYLQRLPRPAAAEDFNEPESERGQKESEGATAVEPHPGPGCSPLCAVRSRFASRAPAGGAAAAPAGPPPCRPPRPPGPCCSRRPSG